MHVKDLPQVIHVTDAYIEFDTQVSRCRKCADILCTKPVDPLTSNEKTEPRPIISGIQPKPVMLIGQAPGLTEYRSGKPFQGQAGQDIRRHFEECGISRSRFDQRVYSAAVVKCFPGSKPPRRARNGGLRREDELPSAAMVENCRPILEQQIELADPQVLVLLGSFPLKAYLRLTGRKATKAQLEDYVGMAEDWSKRRVVFFPHTSGASRWLNKPANRQRFAEARKLLRRELIERGIADAI